ncbi:MAG: glutamate synthase large subunit [Gemmatimonadetes bacterium]|nr:glutamate synthase large subunit [Gemmatimonadota bacterium]
MPPMSQLRAGLDDPRFEKDACGVGFVAHVGGDRTRPLPLALQALRRLEHRGGVGADGVTGDGTGILTALPESLLRREAARLDLHVPAGPGLVVGVLFAPRDGTTVAEAALGRALEAEGLSRLGTRPVPVEPGILGEHARRSAPRILHVLAAPGGAWDPDEVEAACHRARKRFEREGAPGYVVSLSGRTLVYKALVRGGQLAAFYPDLVDPGFRTSFAVFHQRYSTNTLPSWELAQPFRMSAHNGEINTLWGNRTWMEARTPDLPREMVPVLSDGVSDSANLDEAMELLVRMGRPLPETLPLLLVPAWEERSAGMAPGMVGFLRAHAPVMEPWDGPAALAFSDGRWVGASLDRNGFRPCRWLATDDGLVVAASEAGVVDVDPDTVARRGRLGPGQVLLVEIATGRVLEDGPARELLTAAPRPARDAVRRLPRTPQAPRADGARPPHQPPRTTPGIRRLWGLTREDVSITVAALATEEAKDATWSMGDDTAVAPLARVSRPLYAFFRQRFAQVTNPAMDSIREAGVMTLRCAVGPLPSLRRGAALPPLLELESPVLDGFQADEVRRSEMPRAVEVSCAMAAEDGGLARALDRIEIQAEQRVRQGAEILVLSDRVLPEGTLPVPMALAVGAAHRRLLDAGLRARAALVAEAGDCWNVHHLAVLLGFGAAAVHPWLALEAAAEEGGEAGPGRTLAALETALRKVMAKMGISTVASYRGARLFDVLGLAPTVAERCFRGAPNALGGLDMAALEAAVLARGGEAWDGDPLPDHGRFRFRRRGVTERHAWDPFLVRSFQAGLGSSRKSTDGPDPEAWEGFVHDAAAGEPSDLRDLLDVVSDRPPLGPDDVEPRGAVVRRFVSAAMSLGALSPEAHQALTLAMNELGARSNTGEGGEDPAWYRTAPGETRRDGRVKQLASARFGVTPEYLARAEEIEIKIAQGAKPGEGGQLPARKVTALIARLRHARPGMPLISPPPHHDIYSIEDLAQLIFDLKRVNPSARIGVKLVSEAGVGTVAAGVAKANADYIVVSGHNGGTGASPLSSIKHAGSPWETGLAEAQQVLVRSGLRGRVRLRVDGGLRTGRDVVLAALLGAEEFGFGTAPLVALGCDMARQCHMDTCPAGIATQREDLRARFRGRPEHVVRYFLHVADQVRTLLATLGFHSLEEVVGRVELLRQVRWTAGLDLEPVLSPPADGPRRCVQERNDPPAFRALDDRLVAPVAAALARGERFRDTLRIGNGDRAVGARVAGALALQREPTPGGRAELRFQGTAGQSFGAFCHRGMTLILEGEANDYVGKGMGGGTLVLRPTGGRTAAEPHRHVIAGNTLLYGATGGRLFAAGTVGERFAVRNSGATAVVEGAGDHACEYMTGGRVVILGPVGGNVGAGMTGGVAWVLDEEGLLPVRANGDWVALAPPTDRSLRHARRLVEAHVRLTGSWRGGDVLERWERLAPAWVEVRWTGGVTPEAGEEPSEAEAVAEEEGAPPA